MSPIILNLIGVLMLALPFTAIFMMIVWQDGLREALSIYFFTVAFVLWVACAVYLLEF